MSLSASHLPNRHDLGNKIQKSMTGVLSPLPRPEWLPESVWPFQTAFLKFEGCKLAVTDVGKGPVLAVRAYRNVVFYMARCHPASLFRISLRLL